MHCRLRKVRDHRRTIKHTRGEHVHYLVKSIERTPNVDIRFETEVAEGGGDGRLEWIDLALDLIGPLQGRSCPALIDPTFEVTVVAQRPDIVPTDAVVRLAPSHVFEDAESPFASVVPGGGEPTLVARGNRRLIDYVTGAASSAEVVMSVCTGAVILASAGCSTTGPPRPIGPTSTSSKGSVPSSSTSAGSPAVREPQTDERDLQGSRPMLGTAALGPPWAVNGTLTNRREPIYCTPPAPPESPQ